MKNLRLPSGVGWFFVNLTADLHLNSLYLIISVICFSCSKKGTNFLKVQIYTNRHF